MASDDVILKYLCKSDKDGRQSGRKVVPHDSKSDLPLIISGFSDFAKIFMKI